MKKPTPLQIILRIKNNTNLTQPVEILSALSNPYSASNSTNLYTWDLSTETFAGITSIQLGYTIVGDPFGLNTPVIPLATLSVAGVVDALNTTGLAIFQYDGAFIYASSDTYVLNGLVTL